MDHILVSILRARGSLRSSMTVCRTDTQNSSSGDLLRKPIFGIDLSLRASFENISHLRSCTLRLQSRLGSPCVIPACITITMSAEPSPCSARHEPSELRRSCSRRHAQLSKPHIVADGRTSSFRPMPMVAVSSWSSRFSKIWMCIRVSTLHLALFNAAGADPGPADRRKPFAGNKCCADRNQDGARAPVAF